MILGLYRNDSQTCFTPRRSIISWKTSPPLIPTSLFVFRCPLVAAQCRRLVLFPSNVRVIHFGNLPVLQRGDRIPLRLLVKRRTGDGSRGITNQLSIVLAAKSIRTPRANNGTHAAVAVAVLWSRFWGEKRWGELLAAAHDEVNDRLPEAICLWYWRARKALLEDLRGIILGKTG